MLFGDLNDPDSEISKRVREFATTQLRADLRLDPGVRYQGIDMNAALRTCASSTACSRSAARWC